MDYIGKQLPINSFDANSKGPLTSIHDEVTKKTADTVSVPVLTSGTRTHFDRRGGEKEKNS